MKKIGRREEQYEGKGEKKETAYDRDGERGQYKTAARTESFPITIEEVTIL